MATASEPHAGIPPEGSGVVDAAGEFGTVVSHHALTGAGGGLSNMVVVRHREHQVLLPSGLFTAISATSFRIPLSFAALMSSGGQGGNIVIPVLQEEMSIGTRLVDTGRGVRIHKSVVETPHLVEQALLQDELTVEHVAIDRLLSDDEAPQARQEGDVLIVPIVEEVLMVTTRRRLKEEVRIVRSSRLVQQQQTVFLKSEQVAVERFDDTLASRPSASPDTTPAGIARDDATGYSAASPGNALPSPPFADGIGVNAVIGHTDLTAPDHSGGADHPGAPGALQRDVSAGTRLSS